MSGTLENVKNYWTNNPVLSIEFPISDYDKDYFDKIDTIRWTDNEKWAEPKFYDLKGNSDTKILDAGCGIGVFTRYYARKGFKVTGIDLTEKALEITKKSLDIYDLNAELVLGSVEKLPFEDNTFDYIVSNGVIHHTPNTEDAVNEFYRVLKPGGKASVSIYYKNQLLKYPLWPISKLALKILLRKVSGRENMLTINTPEELCKVYDGNETPISKLYTKSQSNKLFSRNSNNYWTP